MSNDEEPRNYRECPRCFSLDRAFAHYVNTKNPATIQDNHILWRCGGCGWDYITPQPPYDHELSDEFDKLKDM